MNLTYPELEAVAQEIESQLSGAYLQEVRAPSQSAVVFSFFQGKRQFVLFCATPGEARLHAISERTSTLPEPPPFVMQVRKLLLGKRLVAVDLPWPDRIVVLRFDDSAPDLLMEFSGHHPNAFLVNSADRILGFLQMPGSHKRSLAVGAIYHPPEAHPKATSGEQRFRDEGPISPQVEAFFASRESQSSFQRSHEALTGQLRREIRRLNRLEKNVRKDIEKLESWQEMKQRGELLKAAIGKAPRGLSEITVTDWLRDPPSEVTIPLDPRLSVKQNMEVCFARYRKGRRGEEVARRRLAEVQQKQARLEQFFRKLEAARTPEQMAALESVAPVRQSEKSDGKKARRQQSQRLPYKQFRSRTGVSILVGRGGKDNQSLTFQVASPDDIWMHVRGFPGSHVIIPRARNQDADFETLLDAAHLAVRYSKGPDAGFAEVMWTRRKFVRSLKGGAPGQVTVERENNLAFDVDPNRPNPTALTWDSEASITKGRF